MKIMNNFILMNKDTKLADLEKIGNRFVITRVYNKIPEFIDDVDAWVSNRTSPVGRRNIIELLKAAQIKGVTEYADISKCISLNDTFWVNSSEHSTTWDKISPYRNKLSRIISNMAIDLEYIGGDLRSPSPDYTVDGSIDKCWKRMNGKIYLYKTGGECWSDLAGKRPYCEYYAQQVALALGIPDYVKYGITISKTKSGFLKPYVYCQTFTNEKYGYVPIGRTVYDRLSYEDLYRKLSTKDKMTFRGMIILDSIIMNFDRHTGNYGFVFDTDNYNLTGLAPVFDNDCSLGALQSVQDISLDEAYKELSKKQPAMELGGYKKQASYVMNKYYADKIRQMYPFKFKRLPKDVDVSDKRMAFMEHIVNSQIRAIFSRD